MSSVNGRVGATKAKTLGAGAHHLLPHLAHPGEEDGVSPPTLSPGTLPRDATVCQLD